MNGKTFAAVEHCLICEDVRREDFGKNALLGFFGATPHVRITLGDPNLPFAKLCFVLLTGPMPAAGTYVANAVIFGPNGQVHEGHSMTMKLVAGPPVMMTLAFGNVTYGLGKQRFVLKIDGVQHFETTFQIEQAPPEMAKELLGQT